MVNPGMGTKPSDAEGSPGSIIAGADQFVNKKELHERLERLINVARDRNRSFLAIVTRRTQPQFDKLASKAIDLQKQIIAAPNDPAEILELKKLILAEEAAFDTLWWQANLWPIVVGGCLLIMVFVIGILSLIQNVNSWGVKEPAKLFTLSFFGALVYLANSALIGLERYPLGDRQASAAIYFVIRVGLAVIVPTVLVVIFLNEKNSGKLPLTPELLSFTTGFSAKLAIDIFNKLVEKVSKMVDAL